MHTNLVYFPYTPPSARLSKEYISLVKNYKLYILTAENTTLYQI